MIIQSGFFIFRLRWLHLGHGMRAHIPLLPKTYYYYYYFERKNIFPFLRAPTTTSVKVTSASRSWYRRVHHGHSLLLIILVWRTTGFPRGIRDTIVSSTSQWCQHGRKGWRRSVRWHDRVPTRARDNFGAPVRLAEVAPKRRTTKTTRSGASAAAAKPIHPTPVPPRTAERPALEQLRAGPVAVLVCVVRAFSVFSFIAPSWFLSRFPYRSRRLFCACVPFVSRQSCLAVARGISRTRWATIIITVVPLLSAILSERYAPFAIGLRARVCWIAR